MAFKRFKWVKNEQGSALLVAILLMTFVIVFGLGVASLIVDSIRVERNVVEAGKSYFAAEAGVEKALYYQENYLPGYEIEEELELTNEATMRYGLTALGDQVPCEFSCEDSDDCWYTLDIQESISLPLFKDDGASGRTDLEFFAVDYYIDVDGVNTAVGDDVLRWKVIGLDTNGGQTEAISGVLSYADEGLGYASIDSENDDAFFYDLTGPPYSHYDSYPISTFLAPENHFLNYLVLTNVMTSTATNMELFVRVRPYDETYYPVEETMVCPYALIEADGVSGETNQSIDVQVKLDSFLPVFDFVLYQTELD